MCNIPKASDSPLLTWAPELLCIHLTTPRMKDMGFARINPGPFHNFSAYKIKSVKRKALRLQN